MNYTLFRPLNQEEQIFICQFIHALIPVVTREVKHPMRDIARWQIALAMWRWTADAVDIQTGAVKKDAYKYNVAFHRHSRKAFKAAQIGGGGLRHEHIVPRMVLAKEIIKRNLNVDDIHKFLIKWCQAVIVTKEEDRVILPRAAMPKGWAWTEGNRDQRYIDCRLMQEICDPLTKCNCTVPQ